MMRDIEKHPEQFEKQEIILLCKECKKLREDPRFTFQAYDLLAGPLGHQHIIRAMNILNKSYFSPLRMERAVAHIADSLNEGGLLITGSNEDGGSTVNGGVYKKIGHRFEMLHQSGAGAPAHEYLSAAQR